MCSLILRLAPASDMPLLVAANRDERPSRPWQPPAAHWPERPDVVGGQDRLAGGSWLAVHRRGLVAAVLNRVGTLGPEPGRRSRGELVLEALDHANATEAARALAHLDPGAYRPFNLVVADPTRAFWIRHDGSGLSVHPIPPGVHMLTARELDDPTCERIRRFLPLFRTSAPPAPEEPEASDWRLLLAAHAPPAADPLIAMCLHTDRDYGTVSASLLWLDRKGRARWLFAAGPPCRVPFRPVAALASWQPAPSAP